MNAWQDSGGHRLRVYYFATRGAGLVSSNVAVNRLITPRAVIIFPITATMTTPVGATFESSELCALARPVAKNYRRVAITRSPKISSGADTLTDVVATGAQESSSPGGEGRAEARDATTFACRQCGATLSFDGTRTRRCPFCDSPNFVERPATPGLPDPQFVVTFVGDNVVAHRALDRWLGSRSMFADSALRNAKVEDLRGVYVPAYLYSTVARTSYTAQIGENYQETETYTTTDANGKSRTETRTVTRTEYRALAGDHLGYVNDVIVTASAGLGNDELQRVEPFDLKQMRRFAAPLISGWITEEFSRSKDDCMRMSRREAVDQIGHRLGRYMPGDSYSDLAYKTTVSWESLDPILVPVWVFAVRYRPDKPPLRVLINGQTGQIASKVPLSPWKIVFAILGTLALIAGIVLGLRAYEQHRHARQTEPLRER